MPFKPKPHKQVCPTCGWKKIMAPDSDALCLPEDIPEFKCPICGGPLVWKPLTWRDSKDLAKLMAKKQGYFKNWFS